MKLPRLLPAALLALGFAGLSHAQVVLFSNLGQQDNGAGSWSDDSTFLANDFLTGGVPRTITEISAHMSNSGLIEQIVLFGIFNDNGIGRPGTLVGLFEVATIPPGREGTFTATKAAGINLQSNTPYWLVGEVLPSTVLGTVSWNYNRGEGTDAGSNFSTVPETLMLFSPNAGENWTSLGAGNLMFSLRGITAVPGPQTWVALLATTGGFLALRRRGLIRRPLS